MHDFAFLLEKSKNSWFMSTMWWTWIVMGSMHLWFLGMSKGDAKLLMYFVSLT